MLEAIAPALGARRALRLWFTPPRATSRPAGAEPSGGTAFRVSVHGRPVVGTRWGNGPLVYLMHGWGGNRRDWDEFVRSLLDAGYGVVTLDAPAHGDSAPGREGPGQATLLEFADALTLVAAEFGRPYGIVAHSAGALGGTIAIEDGLPVERLVFVAPMTDAATFLRWNPVGFGPRTEARIRTLVEQRLGQPLSSFGLVAKAAALADRLPPALIVHDQQDKEIPVADGESLAREWPEAKFHGTHGLGHRRILRDPEVIAAAVRWLADDGPGER